MFSDSEVFYIGSEFIWNYSVAGNTKKRFIKAVCHNKTNSHWNKFLVISHSEHRLYLNQVSKKQTKRTSYKWTAQTYCFYSMDRHLCTNNFGETVRCSNLVNFVLFPKSMTAHCEPSTTIWRTKMSYQATERFTCRLYLRELLYL